MTPPVSILIIFICFFSIKLNAQALSTGYVSVGIKTICCLTGLESGNYSDARFVINKPYTGKTAVIITAVSPGPNVKLSPRFYLVKNSGFGDHRGIPGHYIKPPGLQLQLKYILW